MTYREHMIQLLQAHMTDTFLYFNREFGCSHISSEECIKHDNCIECWKHWLESEVESNDHA